MNIKDIPVVSFGAGSQPEEDDGARLEYIAMPSGMSTFRPPHVPAPDTVEHLRGARDAMRWLQNALASYSPDGAPQLAEITGLDPASRELVDQILGEGEVGVKYAGSFRARTQESVLAGVWRTFYFDAAGRVAHDLLEVAEAPFVASVRESGGAESTPSTQALSDEAMTARAVLAELEEQLGKRQGAAVPHVVNLSLLPVTEADLACLDEVLGHGPVEILSRGYGSCRVSSTAVPGIWWVRYYNSMNTLILNSLEVTDLPLVVRAAPEDIADSSERLAVLMAPYWSGDG